ncbi:hypothetical protein L6164_010862 [Bauhinia variegata]|uniref:Uncharacterized protein n=1 Tax=Bauhinia variegata TaxID=167791 RepID=A0ACB9P438_BAUVA|nr:hypothetical protein L6164_010862 [Bauhinia variegata]
MDKSRLLAFALPFSSINFLFVFSNVASGSPLFSAMFVFGDSLVDDGNNNYLNSLAKANYPPYGIDFSMGVTGRFNNGKTVIDFLGEMLDVPYLPAFADTRPGDSMVLRGVNYASAAAGILDETGRNWGDRYTIGKQVQNFETTLSQLKNLLSDNKNLSQHLAHSLTFVSFGSNDYLNNYLLPEFYATSYIYDPKDYAHLLVDRYRSHILALHELGLRKFFLAAVGPLGCIPNQLARALFHQGNAYLLSTT